MPSGHHQVSRWKHDRPPSLQRFTADFPDDDACAASLVKRRWPGDGADELHDAGWIVDSELLLRSRFSRRLFVVPDNLILFVGRGRPRPDAGSQPRSHFLRSDDIESMTGGVANMDTVRRYDGVVPLYKVSKVSRHQCVCPSGYRSVDHTPIFGVVSRWVARGIVGIVHGHLRVTCWNEPAAQNDVREVM
jgi:hypothetical protein